MENIISCENLSFSYKQEEGEPIEVLKELDLQIKKGNFVVVLGHNGCGKSTLAKHFNCILLPDEGVVQVCDMLTNNEENVVNIRSKVGMVFQNPDNQIVEAIIEDDVAFALENLGVDPKEIRVRVDEALKEVHMYHYKNHSPHQVSGGQKQRVAIAGVVAMRPDCIVLDEPTAMLDPKGRGQVLRTINKLNNKFKITVVLITHNMEEAVHADRVICMDHGKIILDGTPREVFSNVETLLDVGLDVPAVTRLAYELKKEGVDIKQDIITEEECVEELKRLLLV